MSRHQSRWGRQALGAEAVLARLQQTGWGRLSGGKRHSPQVEAGAGCWVKWPDFGAEAGLGLEQTFPAVGHVFLW